MTECRYGSSRDDKTYRRQVTWNHREPSDLAVSQGGLCGVRPHAHSKLKHPDSSTTITMVSHPGFARGLS